MVATQGWIEAGKKNLAEANAKRKDQAEARRLARWEISERKRLIKKLIKLMKLRTTQIRKQEALARIYQHGVTIGDYTRCRKLNGTACDPCKAIAAQYVREKFHADPKYKEAEKAWKKANPDKIYRDNKDRALKHGAKHKYYTRQQIIDRDGLNCHICNREVDFQANHIVGQPGWELYPHIDHVIPIAKGGDDTLDNVKLAHAKCNTDKGAN